MGVVILAVPHVGSQNRQGVLGGLPSLLDPFERIDGKCVSKAVRDGVSKGDVPDGLL